MQYSQPIWDVILLFKKILIWKYWQIFCNTSKFANLRNMKLLVLFRFIYICKQTFSIMNIIKTKLGFKQTDVH